MAGGPQNKIDTEFNYDMTQHLDTWADFSRLAAWVGGSTVAILILMYVFMVPHG